MTPDLDPLTLWFYRGVLVAVALVCLAVAVYALSRAGNTAGVQGLNGLFSWISGYRTYLISTAIGVVVALNQLDYLSDARMNVLLILLGGGGLATLRAGMAKAEKSAEVAETAAKVSAVKVEQAVSVVVAKVSPVTRLRVPEPSPHVVASSPVAPDLTRVPRERDLT